MNSNSLSFICAPKPDANPSMRVDLPLDNKTVCASGPPGHRAAGPPGRRAVGRGPWAAGPSGPLGRGGPPRAAGLRACF